MQCFSGRRSRGLLGPNETRKWDRLCLERHDKVFSKYDTLCAPPPEQCH